MDRCDQCYQLAWRNQAQPILCTCAPCACCGVKCPRNDYRPGYCLQCQLRCGALCVFNAENNLCQSCGDPLIGLTDNNAPDFICSTCDTIIGAWMNED